MRDLTNQRFGRQIAIKCVGVNKWRNAMWLCLCDCGKEHIVSSGKLVQGKSMSCGCLANDLHIQQFQKHGITTGGKPRTFIIWCGMKARCYNEKAISFKAYGGRGVKMCAEWLTFENFHNWALGNGYADGLQIDRIDNGGNYCPENCQWISQIQNLKKHSLIRHIEICGQTKCVSEWCRVLHIPKSTAYKYLNESEESFITYCTGEGQQYFINKLMDDIA